MGTTLRRIFLDGTHTFKPGDPRPEGYIDWMAWAEAQHQAGIGQVQCRTCRLWNFPQELVLAETAPGGPLCRDCAP